MLESNQELNYCQIPQGTPVMVTGATGFTGKVLTRKLVDAGLNVSAVARVNSDITPLSDLKIKWYRGDVADEKLMHQAMQGQEYVFHLASTFRIPQCDPKELRNTHLRSTQLIVEEAQKNTSFKRYIHVSTCGVHGHIDHPPANEDYRFSPGDEYQQTKLEAELWLKKYASEKNLSHTIIRPAAIYGPGEMRFLKLFRMILWPYFPLLGKGKFMYHLIHVDDLTNALLLAATHPAANQNVFLVGADEPVTITGIANFVADHFNKKLRPIRLPIAPFFLVADICEAICKLFKIEPPIYRRRVAFYSKDRHFDVSKMHDVLGFTPKHTNLEGIIETADWYVKNKLLKP